MALLNNAMAIMMVVLGLGFVIFIHELGHFLLAKWNGVKVEKFAIGFDVFNLRLWSKTIGETTYVLGALPLGGYVKMLGEEPSEVGETAGDPRAYHNRPVGARMAIISAGVVMNLLFGLACFTYVYLRGKPEMPPVVGAVIAGMPAYDAGLQPGDRVVRVDGRPIQTYSELQQAMIFSGKDQQLRVELERPGQAQPIAVTLSPRLRPGALGPTIGIGPSFGLEIAPKSSFLEPAGFTGDSAALEKSIGEGGRVTAAGVEGQPLQPIETKPQLDQLLAVHADRPITLDVRDSGTPAAKAATAKARQITLPAIPMVDLGAVMTTGPIIGIRPGSVAAEAGLKVGDRITAVDGATDVDPLRLPDLAFRKGDAGEAIALTIERPGPADSAPPELLQITLQPDAEPSGTQSTYPDEALELPALGLALTVEPKISAVRPDSPAARAGLKPGDVVRFVELTEPAAPAADADDKAATPSILRLVLDGKRTNRQDELATWPGAFELIQSLPLHEITLTLVDGPQPVRLTPEPVEGWFNARRGLRFLIQMQPLPPQNLGSALGRAWKDTVDNVMSVYYMLRGLIQQTLPGESVGGPIKIADWAYSTARLGLDAFIPFLGMLSINLAVVNFLPIPPLDGGQLLFLICEKIRGRPIPERLAGPVMIAGLLFILMLFVVVNLNDVMSYFGPGR